MNIDIKEFSKFNSYLFYEKEHKYYWNDKQVKLSVTKFVSQFFEPFDKYIVATQYAKKYNIPNVDDVLDDWEKQGLIATITGTIVHKFLEDYARGKIFEIDFSEAIKYNLEAEVKERLNILLPQAENFHFDTLGKLIPVQLEYTVGIEDIIAGNIDMLCWNERAQEFQIWDYKNLKQMTTNNEYGQYAKFEFSKYEDCKLVHYSMQQYFYKCILERVLNIKIGKCYLVHFCHLANDYEIYECINMEKECNEALDRLIMESKK